MKHRLNVLPLAFLLFATVAFAQQQADFVHQTYPASPSTARIAADLNNDGAIDVVTNSFSQPSIFVSLSQGSAGFPLFVEYPISSIASDVSAADADGDGNVDIIATVNNGIDVLYGKGDGTLSPFVHYSSGDINPLRAVAADFNLDGKKDVLVVGGSASDDNFYARFFTNTGNRTFSFGGGLQISAAASCCDFTALGWGDFDGDGHADFFVERIHQANFGPNTDNDLYTFFGNGAGQFTAGANKTFNGALTVIAADLNSDGKTDIVGALALSDDSFNTTSTAFLFEGNSGRTLTEKDLFTFPGGSSSIQVADFNGDGTNDIAFFGDDRVTPGLWLGLQQNGSFTIEKTANSVSPDLLGDFDHDGRPDLAQADPASPTTLEVLYNRTQNSFNFCAQPAHGVSICAPGAGSTNTNGVMFSASAADFAPIRKLELWEGSMKLVQQFYGYFNYAFLNASLTLPAGSHTVTVLATGYDHAQTKKSVTFTVGAASGCSTPTSGIHVCEPVDNSVISAGSSVHAVATGMSGTAKMEVDVDGVRKSLVSGSHLDVHFTLGVRGTRKITFSSFNSAGTKTATKTLTITVQ